jgi:MFS superfamily sulfate permease-like transporter
MTFTGLGTLGIHVLGELPSGFPVFGPPPMHGRDVDGLFALALACFLLATVETNAVSRTFGLKHGYRTDANQDFLAIGASNLLVGVAQGYPVSGGMSQSAVNDASGARTPLSLVVAGLILCLIAVFFSAQFRNLPEPILASVVLVAIRGLVKPAAFREVYRFSRAEFAVALVALAAVLAFGVLKGVLLAAAFSLVLLLQRAMHPTLALLGRRPGTEGFSELRHDPKAERLPATVLAKPYGGLLYFNTDAVRQRLFEILAGEGTPKLVVLSLSVVPIVDLAGAKLLRELRDELAGRGITLRLAEVNQSVFESLRALDLDRELAVLAPHEPLGDVVTRAGAAAA